MRIHCLILGVLIAASAATANAMPPPIPVEVTVLSREPGQGAAADAAVWFLADRGLFARLSPIAPGGDACLDARDLRACLHRKRNRPTGVTLIVSGEAGLQTWRCIGSGPAPADEKAQTLTVRLPLMMFGGARQAFAEQQRAAACILAAAREDR